MIALVTTPNIDRTDDVYAALLAAHDGLEPPAIHALNARLILILANHIGDADTLIAAVTLARATAPSD